MPIEQRVVSGSKIGGNTKIGGGARARRARPRPTAPKAKKPKKSKKKLLIIVLVAVLALGGGGAYLFLGKGGGEPAAAPAPEKGAVLTIDPVSLNLAEGHYLRLGLALQLTDEGRRTEVPDTSRGPRPGDRPVLRPHGRRGHRPGHP